VLFYATDDDRAGAAIERLITVCGVDPVSAGGVTEGDEARCPRRPAPNGALGGNLLNTDQAHAAIAAA
jgi:predicted dinucleotide-binding enzyme